MASEHIIFLLNWSKSEPMFYKIPDLDSHEKRDKSNQLQFNPELQRYRKNL